MLFSGYLPERGILLMICAVMIVPLMDGVAKYLSSDYPVLLLVWARFFFHLCIMLPIALWHYGPGCLKPPRFWLQMLRSLSQISGTLLFFGAISLMPQANALALLFVYPFIISVLAIFILGEQVDIHRWLAVLTGFVGVLFIVRPGSGMDGWGALLALGAGVSYSLYMIMTRMLAGSAPSVVMLNFTGIVGTVLLSFLLPFIWQMPTLPHLGLMMSIGVFAALAHFLIILACHCTPASRLAPYGYSEMVMATIVGYVMFGDFPDVWAWAGIAIITGSGIYISVREHWLHVRAGRADALISADI